jgi:hypothetical protein
LLAATTANRGSCQAECNHASQALDEFKTAFNELSAAVEKYNVNLKDTKNKNWAKNVESCRLKVKAALDKATDKLNRLQAALEQFKIDSVKSAKADKDGVMKPDADAQRQISSVEFALGVAKETLNDAISITTIF